MAIFDHQEIYQFFSERLHGQSYWLGARKDQKNVGTWVHGEEIEYGESWVDILDVDTRSKKCLRIGKVGQLRFDGCTDRRPFLCEFPSRASFSIIH